MYTLYTGCGEVIFLSLLSDVSVLTREDKLDLWVDGLSRVGVCVLCAFMCVCVCVSSH